MLMRTLTLAGLSMLVALATPATAGEVTSSAFRDCPQCPLMVTVPAGSFEMGSTDAKEGNGDEVPRYRVTFRRPFAIGANEVTRGEFARFVAATGFVAAGGCNTLVDGDWKSIPERDWASPGFPQADDEPVVCVNWPAARAYAEWLTQTTSRPYRLLSEAEWEYLARHGQGDRPMTHDTANYGAETCCRGRVEGKDRWEKTAPVGSFAPDDFGAHDLLGNVWEWLDDCYHENYVGAPDDGTARIAQCSSPDRRVVRGGGYGDARELLRPGYRLRAPLDNSYATLGFRVARGLD
jgi:formylglycine-generating enzyme required for sulfatase activity